MIFKVEQSNLQDGSHLIFRTDEFDELEDALEMFFNLKEGIWSIEEDTNHLTVITSDDEVILEHEVTTN